ncbi:MAG: ParB/RepB/Spo0J family partition protein [Planctomycetota bacterium]|jgi:ParB family chromosome partitioning protein
MAKNAKNKKARLGRGLSSLMSTPAVIDAPVTTDPPGPPTAAETPDPPEQADNPGTATLEEPQAPSDASREGKVREVDGASANASESNSEASSSPEMTDNPGAAIDYVDPRAETAPEPATAEALHVSTATAPPPHAPDPDLDHDATREDEANEGSLIWVDVLDIRPNPYQPRRIFDDQALDALSESIRQDGVMQPIVVRHCPSGEGYEIVTGERRWRAAQRAEAHTVPAILRELDDEHTAEWALVENLQREDLNPIERAHAFQGLSETFHLTHEQVAERVGVDRSTVTNTLRLLDLHEDVQILLQAGNLSAGHSRALLAISDLEAQAIVARKAADEGWSVRVTEAEVKRLNQDPTAKPAKASKGKAEQRAAHLVDLEERIGAHLQTKVRLKSGRKKGAGSITIEFYDFDHFDELLTKFGISVD